MKRLFKIITFLILLPSLCLSLIIVNNVKASQKVVRVGWFESNYNITDDEGRRSGYSYEYQQAIAKYTGWKYEYVQKSWSELLEMLNNCELDLLSDVSYTPERAQNMIYSNLPMGTEDYYIYKSPNNHAISNDDYQTFNGKKVGVNKGSVMIDLFNSWQEKNNVNAQIVELKASVKESLDMLKRGEIDMYISMDGTLDITSAVPLVKFGSSDFYFAIRKDMPELANELNVAMNKLNEADPYFVYDLHHKYFKGSAINYYLSDAEKLYLENHKKIRVGYQDNYLAFCAKDKNGELTGFLKEYLNIASTSFKNGVLEFETKAYDTSDDVFKALKNGEIDCVFPSNLTVYDSENENLFITSRILKSEILAIVAASEQRNFFSKERIDVAVCFGDYNYNLLIAEEFPNWNKVVFNNPEECLKGIKEGKADCFLISNYRYNDLATKCNEYGLQALSTGAEINYSFAVNRSDLVLCSILNKFVTNIPESSVNSAMSFYYAEGAKQGYGMSFNKFFGIITIILAVIAVIILALIFRMIYIDRRSKKRQMLIQATEIDDVTGLYNKTFFIEYINKMYEDSPEEKMDAVSLYIDHFRSIKELNGEAFANQLLSEVSDEIKVFLKENGGIGGYSDDGRFCMYFHHIYDYQGLYSKIQDRIEMMSPFSNIRIRMGARPYQANLKPTTLIEEAEMACSKTRTEYKEYLIIFDEEMKKKEAIKEKLINDLQQAIENNEFKVYYQPKYDIKEDEYKIIGAEALLRWEHPELGLIEPTDFIPLFEKNGEIGRIDRVVRSKVVKEMAKWKSMYNIDLPVSVNVSRIEAMNQTFEDSLNVLLEENGINKKSLIIEINETSMIDNINQFAALANRMRKHGYLIELDDFGKEILSLKLLSNINIDAIKIDRLLVSDIKANEKIINLIIAIGKFLKVPVIAEGVENKEQLLTLKKLGCNIVQGFYLSKPLLADEYIELIK